MRVHFVLGGGKDESCVPSRDTIWTNAIQRSLSRVFQTNLRRCLQLPFARAKAPALVVRCSGKEQRGGVCTGSGGGSGPCGRRRG